MVPSFIGLDLRGRRRRIRGAFDFAFLCHPDFISVIPTKEEYYTSNLS
jgi:hypothetical protein